MHRVKNNKGYASISIDATPPKQESRYLNGTFRVDSLFTKYFSESVMYLVLYFFLKYDTNHSWTPFKQPIGTLQILDL